MSDRSKRNERERIDRQELAAYREITAEELALANPKPEDLREALKWRGRVLEFVNTIGLRRKPYFQPEELPK